MKLFSSIALLALLTLLLPRPARADEPLIPMEDFFRNPEQSGFQLSPNGEYISFMKPWERRMNIFVQKIGAEEAVRVTSATERDIPAYFWSWNDRIVYLQDRGGDENYRLYAVSSDGTESRELTPFENTRVTIVDSLEEQDDFLLIGMNRRDQRLFDVYRLNLATGDLTLLEENPGDIAGWMTDHDGKLRVAVRSDGVNTSLLYRDKEDEPFRNILTTDFRESVSPLFFTFDNKKLYVASNLGRDKSAIFVFDPQTVEHEELLFEHPDVDVSSLFRSRKRKVITGTGFTTDRFRYHFFDEQRAALQKELEERLPDDEVVVASMSRDETKVLVYAGSDRTRGTYFFFDRETKDFRKLAELAPWLPKERMAPMKHVSYTSRDGLTIHGYLTLPLGKEPKNLPVVIHPHGGPWVRDGWGFDPQVQFLANRGLAVLQMNFRGSTGY